jgi:hypothetical protein
MHLYYNDLGQSIDRNWASQSTMNNDIEISYGKHESRFETPSGGQKYHNMFLHQRQFSVINIQYLCLF